MQLKYWNLVFFKMHFKHYNLKPFFFFLVGLQDTHYILNQDYIVMKFFNLNSNNINISMPTIYAYEITN